MSIASSSSNSKNSTIVTKWTLLAGSKNALISCEDCSVHKKKESESKTNIKLNFQN